MAKGSDRERAAAELYKRAGYATYRPATVRYGENDVWGLFDLLCIRPDGDLRAVQVKSNRAAGIRDWTRQTWLWRRVGFVTEYAVPYDREGWRLIEATDDGHTTLYDERKDGRVSANRSTDLNLGDGLVEYLEGVQP